MRQQSKEGGSATRLSHRMCSQESHHELISVRVDGVTNSLMSHAAKKQQVTTVEEDELCVFGDSSAEEWVFGYMSTILGESPGGPTGGGAVDLRAHGAHVLVRIWWLVHWAAQ